ncbi:MAG TPA: hypothetical protein PK112_01780 [candidate division Zixibacteria bacterium]|nr:hypothetical protein [candidate division Zixibacteria bacterium]
MGFDADVAGLVGEYAGIPGGNHRAGPGSPASELAALADWLVEHHAWTPSAARHLVELVARNGTFVLRNALALSIVLGVEDGELGL